MGRMYLFVLAVFLLSLVSAQTSFDVEEIDRGSTIIKEVGGVAKYDLLIENTGVNDNVEIYTLVSVIISPKEKFYLPTGEKQISIEARPTDELIKDKDGLYVYQYQIKGEKQGIYIDKLSMRIVSISDALEIEGQDLLPDSNDGKILIKNKENVRIENFEIKLKSPFFDVERTGLNIGPKETIEIPFILDKEETSKLKAGNYLISGEVKLNDVQKRINGEINYLEKEGLSVMQDTSGFILVKNTINKTNKGNTVVESNIEMRKDIISRLVTVYSTPATSSKREGLFVYYLWEKELLPGETFEVRATTNYTLPFIILILVIVIVYFAARYYSTDVILNKRVTYVKTSDGEFAVKVSLHVKAKKSVENLKVIDRVPNSTKIYNKFGITPTKIDHATRRLIWEANHLKAGEERWYSYIVYSKLKIFGKFEFPSASAVYKVNGKAGEVFSNKTYFLNESK